jgi:hypothetical protein
MASLADGSCSVLLVHSSMLSKPHSQGFHPRERMKAREGRHGVEEVLKGLLAVLIVAYSLGYRRKCRTLYVEAVGAKIDGYGDRFLNRNGFPLTKDKVAVARFLVNRNKQGVLASEGEMWAFRFLVNVDSQGAAY